jgi:hypothetical protein
MHRVLFEPGDPGLRIDLGILNDERRLVMVGEVKVDPKHPADLYDRMTSRYAMKPPGPEPVDAANHNREEEAWALATRLWKIRPAYLWLTAPGVRDAYRCEYEPLRLHSLADLPRADELGLQRQPASMLATVDYRLVREAPQVAHHTPRSPYPRSSGRGGGRGGTL